MNFVKGINYRLLPEREVQSIPFEECAMDLIGPWIVQVRGNPYEFSALTAIDTVTNLVGPRGAPCTASTSTAGRLRDGSSG